MQKIPATYLNAQNHPIQPCSDTKIGEDMCDENATMQT